MITSVKDLVDAHLEGRKLFRSWSKVPSQTTASGIWFDLSMSPGNPVPQYYFATQATRLARSTDGGLDHGPDLGAGYKKYLSHFDITTATATAAGSTFQLLDYLLFYGGVAMDVGIVELTNNVGLSRYTSGRGVQIMAVEQNPYVSGGATFQITYTNQDGVAGRLTPIVRCNTQVSTGTIVTSAPASAGCIGPFIPLQDGDTGVRSIQSIEFFVGDVGLLALVLVKPLAYFQIYENTAPNFYEMWRDFKFLPKIEDDAYLNLICRPNGTLAAAQIQGNITTIWSAD